MTELEAVNIMIRALGEPPVTSISGDDEAEEAQDRLTEENENVQRTGPGPLGGWIWNEEPHVTLNYASVSLTGTITSGTFTIGEVVTQASSGATGIITSAYTVGDTTFLICPTDGSAAFNGTNNITGATSGTSTATVTAVSNPTSGVIQLPRDVIKWRCIDGFTAHYAVERNRRVYDGRNDYRTFTWSSSIEADLVRLLDFTYLPDTLARHIAMSAAVQYQLDTKRGQVDHQQLTQRAYLAHRDAVRADRKTRRTNLLTTTEARAFKGHRRRTHTGAFIT
jgi:hypothetical protein